jgi:hypothetical protein
MKDWHPAWSTLYCLCLIAFGTLVGLAASVFSQSNLLAVTPLFANSIGAAVGAALTVWITVRRGKAEKEAVAWARLNEAIFRLKEIASTCQQLSDIAADDNKHIGVRITYRFLDHLLQQRSIIENALRENGRPREAMHAWSRLDDLQTFLDDLRPHSRGDSIVFASYVRNAADYRAHIRHCGMSLAGIARNLESKEGYT